MFRHRKRFRARFGCILFVASWVQLLAWAPVAVAHGIVGNRLFPGTQTFDDPAVADELTFSPYSSAKHPARDGSTVTDTTIDWSLMRLLTPNVGIGIDQGYVRRNWVGPQSSGFDNTRLTVKALLLKNEPSEFMLSAGLAWGIGGTGTRAIGATSAQTLQPAIFFGKGFGDLPDTLGWLRPFGITGSVAADLPLNRTSVITGLDETTSLLTPRVLNNLETLHWGFSLQYSTYYLSRRFTGGPAKEEPLHQLVPLVEFTFDTPRGQKTATTMSPGFAYVGDTWQLAIEAMVPLNSEAGRSVGVRTQLLLFLDDLAPSIFGKPLLGAHR